MKKYADIFNIFNSKMSNAFDQLMESGGSAKGKKTGRPKHSGWFGYEEITENGKKGAKCLNCSKILHNTGADRMKAHR